MASTRYKSSKETTNASRVSRLVMGPCTDLFRDLLRFHIPETRFPRLLNKDRRIIKPLVKGPQRDMLYPDKGSFSATYSDFDISLLYILLRNSCSIPPHRNAWGHTPDPNDFSLSANIDRIREIRNKHCGHSPQVVLSDSEFASVWSYIRKVVKDLESHLGNQSTYVDAVDFLETETMDPEVEKYYLDVIDEQIKTDGNVNQLLDELMKQNSLQDKKQNKMMEHQTEILENQIKHERILRSVESKMDKETENVIESTKKVLESHSLSPTYTRTKAVKTAIEHLKKHHISILTGKGGEGKTTTAYEVLCQMFKRQDLCTPMILDSPKQWDKMVDSHQTVVVYLDDIVGRTNINTNEVEKWRKKLDKMYASAKLGQVFILLGLRKSILDEMKDMCDHHSLFHEDHIIDLSSDTHKLSQEEKQSIIDKFEKHMKEKQTEQCNNMCWTITGSKKDIITKADPYYGFPLTCFLFFTRKEFFELGTSFFTHPNKQLFNDIERLRKETSHKLSYCILVYIFLNARIDLRNFDEKEIIEISSVIGLHNVNAITVRDACKSVEDVYISTKDNNDIYSFSHESIPEAVLLSFGQLSPDIVIKNCDNDTLLELIRTESYERKSAELVLQVPRRHYQALADRFMCVLGNTSIPNVINFYWHQAFKDKDFLDVLFSTRQSKTDLQIYSATWRVFLGILNQCYSDRRLLITEMLNRFGPHLMADCTKDDDVIVHNETFMICHFELKYLLDIFVIRKRKLNVCNIVQYVIQHANPDYFLGICNNYNQCGMSPDVTVIQYMIAYGWDEIIDSIINALPLMSVTCSDNWTCVNWSVYFGRFSLFKKFVDFGHNVSGKTREGYTVLQTAILGLRYLCTKPYAYFTVDDKIAKVTLSAAPVTGKSFYQIISYLVEIDSSVSSEIVDPVDKYNNNVIHYLIILNFEKSLSAFREINTDVLLHRSDTDLPTALHVAVYLGRDTIVKFLIQAGVHPEKNDISLAKTLHDGKRYSGACYRYINTKGWIKDKDKYSTQAPADIRLKAICFTRVHFGSETEYIATEQLIKGLYPN